MERRELEVAASRVAYMRGLLALPLGVVFILIGLGNLGWSPLQVPWVFFLGVGAAGLVWLGLNRYYTESYGRVTPGRQRQTRYAVATIFFGVAVIGGPLLDGWLHPRVSLFAALFAVAMLAWYALCVDLRTHHVLVWGTLFVAALLPVWGSFADPVSVAWLPIAAATILGGLLDHRELARGFGPTKGELTDRRASA
ncbi:MAG: hypothetical protein M3130_03080 [Actinomycetota bacterium]|nr:hypothetical protein [Actinomycetota bacterium]